MMIPDKDAQSSDMGKPQEAFSIQFLPRLHSRRKLHQQCPIQKVITTIGGEINRFHSIQRHRMNQTQHVSSRDIVHQNGTLVSIRARNRRDRRLVFVARLTVFKLDHCVAVAEKPFRGQTTWVEDDGGDVRWHVGVGVGGCVLHVCAYGGRTRGSGGVVDVVEEDTRNGNILVAFGVACPCSVDIDVGDYGGVGTVCEIRVDVSERFDVRVAVQDRDAVDVVLVGRVASCAGAASRVDDDLPLDLRVGGDGGSGVCPG